MQDDDIKAMIESGLPGCTAYLDGDGRHFDATVICEGFAGKSILEQHRMVYASLGDSMQEAIHALSIKTYTPEAWEKAGKLQVSKL